MSVFEDFNHLLFRCFDLVYSETFLNDAHYLGRRTIAKEDATPNGIDETATRFLKPAFIQCHRLDVHRQLRSGHFGINNGLIHRKLLAVKRIHLILRIAR